MVVVGGGGGGGGAAVKYRTGKRRGFIMHVGLKAMDGFKLEKETSGTANDNTIFPVSFAN